MRKVVYGGAMSLDGFIAGPNGEYDWIVTDPDIDFAAMMARFDTFLIGRKTFEAMRRMGSEAPPTLSDEIARQVNSQPPTSNFQLPTPTAPSCGVCAAWALGVGRWELVSAPGASTTFVSKSDPSVTIVLTPRLSATAMAPLDGVKCGEVRSNGPLGAGRGRRCPP